LLECENDTAIKIGDYVHFTADKGVVGVVVKMGKVGGTTQYKVFADNREWTLSEDQIEIHQTEQTVDVAEVRRRLTAYLIKKPSSDSLYSLNAARIDFVPYQFRPALKIIKNANPRLLIADGVGVGKTIEAGLILKELQARHSINTALIICPRALVSERKWEKEMKRFDEDFENADGPMLRNIISDADRDGEWPVKHNRLIIPDSLLTEDLLAGTTEKRGRRRQGLNDLDLDSEPYFDLVIVDEAHRIRNSNAQRYKCVKFFCENANAVVFLTATPIQLGSQDLYTLLNLLFPDQITDEETFNAMAQPNALVNAALSHLRRQKESEALTALKSIPDTGWGKNVIADNPVYKNAVTALSSGALNRERRVQLIGEVESLHSFAQMINRTRRKDIEDFCVRRAQTVESTFTARQRELHDELIKFISDIMSIVNPSISIKFLTCTLRRQAASCIFGLAPFVKVITDRGLAALATDSVLVDEAEIPDDFNGDEDQLHKTEGFKEFADRINKLAKNLPPEDNKFDTLADVIRKRQTLEKNKTIIFTSFRHTIYYLKRKIGELGGVRVEFVHGGIKDDERYDLRERFVLPKNNPNAIDVLLFTEVGSEGLDYQFCDCVVNYDLPWNPMRVEQRIGRIDRRGQKSETAQIYNCVTEGTIDKDIFERCLERIGVFKESIGDCDEILGELERGINGIMFDPKLTEDERKAKIEQLADNEVGMIQEMRRLEDEQKNIFGVDITGFTSEVVNATNPWLSPDSLKRLVEGYLERKFGAEKPKMAGNKITLTAIDKAQLLEDYNTLRDKTPDTIWRNYLRSTATVANITFDPEEAKNPKMLFLTPTHPLVRLAAKDCYSEKTSTISITSNEKDTAPGVYPFQLYIWEYTGERPLTKLQPVCGDTQIREKLSSIMQNAESSEDGHSCPQVEWDKLAESHLALWQTERQNYRDDAATLCRYKSESLKNSAIARKSPALKQLESVTDEKIIAIRKREIEKIDADYAVKLRKFEENARMADIHCTLLVNGVLTVGGIE
jgi:superfamily II DNA or RNA helicase